MSENHAPKSLENGRVICTCGDYNCASLTQIKNVEYSEKEFHEKYKSLESPAGEEYWSWRELQAAKIPTNRIWTIVETGDEEDGNWYALPGYHIVNKIDYCVTEVPWEHESITAVWFEDDFEKDGE